LETIRAGQLNNFINNLEEGAAVMYCHRHDNPELHWDIRNGDTLATLRQRAARLHPNHQIRLRVYNTREEEQRLAEEERNRKEQQTLERAFSFEGCFGWVESVRNSLTTNRYTFRVDPLHKIMVREFNGVAGSYRRLTAEEVAEYRQKYESIRARG